MTFRGNTVGRLVLAAVAGLAAGAGGAEPAAHSPLTADGLLLLYNRDDPRSRELAEYYARVRSVPAEQILAVRARLGEEEIPREQFDADIREPVRRYLETFTGGAKIRCIVPFYGLPIRVGPKRTILAEQHLARKWQQELGEAIGELEQAVGGIEPPGSRPASGPENGLPDEGAWPQLLQRYQQAVAATGRRLEEAGPQTLGGAEYKKLVLAMQAVEGPGQMLFKTNPEVLPPDARAVWKQALDEVEAAEARIVELRRRKLTDPSREEARKLIRQNYGLLGLVQSLQYDIALTRTEETTASLDSELSLARYDDYPLQRWLPNALSWRVRTEPAMAAALTTQQRNTPVLMTCRIDGPSMDVARRIIDESAAVEKQGLSGTVYIDARGLKADAGLGLYDEDLRELAKLLWRETDLLVRLDNRPALFVPGECTEAMLYCGWYSLRQYVDAFEFVPGAVGYHIASFEAISIKAPIERGWVKGLLNDGVDATIGPVAEPYLHAFPRPRDFFGLLLTGRFCLAECYAYTLDLHSWMMVPIGDPLYRPFAARPVLKLEQVFAAERVPPEYGEHAGDRAADSPGNP